MSFDFTRRILALLAFSLAAGSSSAAALTLDIYNPGRQALFPVSSVIVSGKRDAILVDAQFGRAQATQLVDKIRASGKHLTTIYISHGDPDYYFGLDTIKAAFPDAKIVASAQTVAHIQQTLAAKLAFWGPKLGADAPQQTIVPEILQGDTLTLEGQQLKVIGLDGPQAQRSFVWIPTLKAVVGGVVVADNLHIWMADTQTARSHREWLQTLKRITGLHPKTVVPGHYGEGASMTIAAVTFTRDYILAFDQESAKAHDAAALIAAMKARYPTLSDTASLELSARVAKGEMKW